MTPRRLKIDIAVASFLAVIFLVVAGALMSPMAIEMLSRTGEINDFLQPYLRFMSFLALFNTFFILALVVIRRRAAAWFANISIWAAVILSTFIAVEVGSLVLIKQLFNVQHVGSRYTNGFVFSPTLGIVPKPNFRFSLTSGEITHTADGYRGPEPPPLLPEGQKTILLIGGSSTYDLGLPDNQTWPSVLGRIFGEKVRVINLGIPGHSTAEHIVLASMVAWKYQPDFIIYYIGWNDIRSSHVNESTDYSYFHRRKIFESFAVTEPRSFFAIGYVMKKIISILDDLSLYNLSTVNVEPNIKDSVDEGLLDIYTHNVAMLAAVTRSIGAEPIFIPQIMNEHRLTSDKPYQWIPQVPQRAVPGVLAAFNEAMMRTALASDATVLPEVLMADWQDVDFVDRGHFSERGARRFACVVAGSLVEHGVLAAVTSRGC